MAKYIGTYENQAAVEAAIQGGTLNLPFVAYTTGNTKQVFYGSALDLAVIGDIIVYKTADQSIRFIHQTDYNTTDYPVADYTPIGIAGGNQTVTLSTSNLTIPILGLNWLSKSAPDSGVTSPQDIDWGDTTFDIPELTNYDSADAAKADMDGKTNTEKVLVYATGQTDWQTASAITYTDGQRMYPLFECAWRYHTPGTSQGDWYIATVGQIDPLLAAENKAKIQAAYTKLGKNATWGNSYVGSSSEYSAYSAWYWDGSSWDGGSWDASSKELYINFQSVPFSNLLPQSV